MSNNKIVVAVQQKHINKGEQMSDSTCAIALALAEMFDTDEVSVDETRIVVDRSNGFAFRFSWKEIPAVAKTFIKKFDKDKESVKPFSFSLPFFQAKK